LDPYRTLRKEYASHAPQLVAALRVLSIPHWFDDSLGSSLVETFTVANGSTTRLIDRVKRLPIVAPYEGRGWRVVEQARAAFLGPAGADDEFTRTVDAYVANWLDERRNGLSAAEGREMQWRFAWHVAPVEPKRAVETLTALVTSPAAEVADLQSAIELFEGRRPYLSQYVGEASFFAGMLAYRRHEYAAAAAAFRKTLASDAQNLHHVAGHLLGRILSRPPHANLDEAIDVLENARALAKSFDDRRGVVHIGSTLADALIARGGHADLERAVTLLVSIVDDPVARRIPTHLQLGHVLIRLGRLEDARAHLEQVEELLDPSDYETENGLRLSLSRLAEAQGDLAEALVQMDLKLQLDEAAGREDRVKRDLFRIARLTNQLGNG
jgi:tetratricopeptide (TPR) repeat protein